MIKYFSASKLLEYETKSIPQLNGNISEEIEIDSYNSGYQYFLEFLCPQGNKYMSTVIEFSGTNIGKVTIPTKIFGNVGKIFIQLVVRDLDYNIISKSLLSKQPYCIVTKSINATEKIPTEFGYDFVGSAVKAKEDCNKATIDCKQSINDIKNQAEESFLMGKGGTVIKINDKVVKAVSFTANPQSQIEKNSKNIQYSNMLPSCNKIKNIFQICNGEKWYTWNVVANGYIVVTVKSKTTCFFRLLTNNLEGIEYSIILPSNDIRTFLLPVKNGSEIKVYFEYPENILEFKSAFIYAEEVY